MDPNRVEMGWKVIRDATRFILAKSEPVARHGELLAELQFQRSAKHTTMQHMHLFS